MSTSVLTIGEEEWIVRTGPSQAALVAQVQTDTDLAEFPYGLLLWPAAVALAQRLAEDPGLVRGKRILELGCGPGLPGLVARRLGGEVTQTDYQEAPLELARENARLNGVPGISLQAGDWRAFPVLPPFDLVLGSDILYERGLHPALFALLPRLMKPDAILLLSDPLRPASALFMDKLEKAGWCVEMDVREVAWKEERPEIALFTVRRLPE